MSIRVLKTVTAVERNRNFSAAGTEVHVTMLPLARLIDDWLQQIDLKVNETMELESPEAITRKVAANPGVSIVPQAFVPCANPVPVRRIPLGDAAPSRDLILIYRTDNPRNRVIETFHATILDAIEIGKLDVEDPAKP